MREEGLGYTTALAAVALAAGAAAYHLRDVTLATGAAVVAAYVLHLFRLRRMRGLCREACVIERLVAELDGTVGSDTFVRRRFGLGAVALIEGLMGPREVLRTVLATRRSGGPTFAEYALDRGYLTSDEVKALMRTRKEGRFLVDQVRVARRKIQELSAEWAGPPR